jgi:hypothetical protein
MTIRRRPRPRWLVLGMVAMLATFASLVALIAHEASPANALGYGIPVAFAFLGSCFFFVSRFTPAALVGKRALALRTNGRWAFVRLSEIVTVAKRPRYAIAVHTADDHETSADLPDRVELFATLRERLPARCFEDTTAIPMDGRILSSVVAVAVLAATFALGFALHAHFRPPRSDYPIDPGLVVAAVPCLMCGVALWTAPLRFRVTALHVTVRYALRAVTLPIADLVQNDLALPALGKPFQVLTLATSHAKVTLRDGVTDVPVEDVHRAIVRLREGVKGRRTPLP